MRAMTIAGALRFFEGSTRLPARWRGRAAPVRRLLAMLGELHRAGTGSEVVIGFVPGRVEVLGRHTDYAGGRSLVCAIDRGFLFAASARPDRTVRMREDSREFGETSFPLSPSLRPDQGHWTSYPMTMARRLAANFGREGRGAAASRGAGVRRGDGVLRGAGMRAGDGVLRGADVAFCSSLPVGSGMSGSSAFMMTAFTALAEVNGLWAHPAFRANIADPVELAGYLACAENGQGFHGLSGDGGVGTFGGSEDHAAILCGRAGTLSLFRFSPMGLEEEVRWPRDWRLEVAFSGVRAEKTREALEKYNMVSRRARAAVERYNERFTTRHANLGEAVAAGARPKDWRGLEGGTVPGLADRVRQFLAEERRVIPGALRALRAADIDGFGRELNASHRASARFLGNIVTEIDDLQASAIALGARGASGFGAGFGGSILTAVRSPEARGFLQGWRSRYVACHPGRSVEAAFFSAVPGPGIELWTGAGPQRLVDRVFGGDDQGGAVGPG